MVTIVRLLYPRAFLPTAPPQDEFDKEELLKNEDSANKDDGDGDEDDDEDDDDPPVKEEVTQGEDPGMWSETFKSHHDSKPYGM